MQRINSWIKKNQAVTFFLTLLGLIASIYGMTQSSNIQNYFHQDITINTPPAQSQPIPKQQSRTTEKLTNQEKFSTARLTISAAGTEIYIYKRTSMTPYAGGDISSSDSEKNIYLPKNQLLEVSLTGANVELNISRSIAEQININDRGAGNNVRLF